MDNYIVSARKYRPSTFLSVIGQNSLTQTLKNAIAQNKLAHAYLFCGPRGVGKTTCARIFAKTINCSNLNEAGDACNSCESCVAFNEQRSYNIHELDAASNNSVDDIRSLIEEVRIKPQIGKYKVFIIDEVHMLSQAAFNAFLKTLEEPPAHAIFILATTEKHKLLPTILSRCQIYDFNRITIQDTIDHLRYVSQQEGIEAEEEALNIIAQKADGGMRDALSIFDQVAGFSQNKITYQKTIANLNILDYGKYFQLTEYLLSGNAAQALLLFDAVLRDGFDGQYFVSGLSNHIRNLMVSKDKITISLLEVGGVIAAKYAEQALKTPINFLYKALEMSNDCDLNYRLSRNKRLLVEILLLKLCQILNPIISVSDTPTPLQPITPAPIPTTAPIIATEHQAPTAQSAPVIATSQESNSNITSSVPNASTIINAAPTAQPAPLNRGAAIKSFSIKKKLISTELEKEQSVTELSSNLSTPFTQEQLIEVWNRFTETIPTETILVKTMIANPPILGENYQFSVVVDNIAQLERLNERGTDLLKFLRKNLQNDKIIMSARESEPDEKVTILSQADKFRYMAENNPHIIEMKDIFGLESI